MTTARFILGFVLLTIGLVFGIVFCRSSKSGDEAMKRALKDRSDKE